MQIEPFQGDPNLLDAQLKNIIPPIAEAYIEHLETSPNLKANNKTAIQDGIAVLLYTLSKVRGHKVVVGFLGNEPKQLVLVLKALEDVTAHTLAHESRSCWQVAYVLLLWLSHLLLTPFDLTSISSDPCPFQDEFLSIYSLKKIPPLASRILHVGLKHLPGPTKAQDAAALLLLRLSMRPDIRPLGLGESLVPEQLSVLVRNDQASTNGGYEQIGALRFLAGVAASAELAQLIPAIYQRCQDVFDNPISNTIAADAVGKKLAVKIFRNVAILSLKLAHGSDKLSSFLEETSALETIIDYLLRALSDKDTPVRHAAAKAISLIVLELDSTMGYEVIQAVLDTFKEDIPRHAATLDFTTVNPLKWHGLTLTLAQIVLKRSASPDQLPDILLALFSALQFQQRTATGSTLGTSVRDAANFGIWSLARRYTTAELSSVPKNEFSSRRLEEFGPSIIQLLAIELIISACLDPSGNIRRGSSAALQELIGRHPDEVLHGIALVQIVDYQAVGLRNRGMIEVAKQTASMHQIYWTALLDGLLGWRGLGSHDVPSREGAAASIAGLFVVQLASGNSDLDTMSAIRLGLRSTKAEDLESFHGYLLTVANMLKEDSNHSSATSIDPAILWSIFTLVESTFADFGPRLLRTELPASSARLLTELLHMCNSPMANHGFWKSIPHQAVDFFVEQLLTRREGWLLRLIPELVIEQQQLTRSHGMTFSSIDLDRLADKLAIDSCNRGQHGAGRAIALGTLCLRDGIDDDLPRFDKRVLESLTSLVNASDVDWRIIGADALQYSVRHAVRSSLKKESVQLRTICDAIQRALNDYTIDERGDIGSLVRIRAISCVSAIFETGLLDGIPDLKDQLADEICRLSLEKLDRVRLQAAECRERYLELNATVVDIASVSHSAYFAAAILSIVDNGTSESRKYSLVKGCMSCAGTGSESLLLMARRVLATYLTPASEEQLTYLMTTLLEILKTFIAENAHGLLAGLEFLAFLLESGLIDPLYDSSQVKWRSLLITVQKAHFKSSDIPRLLTAVQIYIGLARISSIRQDVLKKLLGMLKTNPFPRVRFAIADALWLTTANTQLKAFTPASRPDPSSNFVARLQDQLF